MEILAESPLTTRERPGGRRRRVGVINSAAYAPTETEHMHTRSIELKKLILKKVDTSQKWGNLQPKPGSKEPSTSAPGTDPESRRSAGWRGRGRGRLGRAAASWDASSGGASSGGPSAWQRMRNLQQRQRTKRTVTGTEA